MGLQVDYPLFIGLAVFGGAVLCITFSLGKHSNSHQESVLLVNR